jgi:6-phosphofructokinase 1
MKRIAILTSGGDASGMNAAIRAVVRTGLDKGWEVMGIRRGYEGLLAGDFVRLTARDVGGIIQRGGTMLGSSRCADFKTDEGRLAALKQLHNHSISDLIIIGGNGTQAGAHKLSNLGVPIIGIASTIDNDLYGTEISLGVDTALNVALEAIDRLKVTASSHNRAFLVETMGRKSGYLALMAGIAGGAEAIVIPEVETDPEVLAEELRQAYIRGKAHAMVVVAEGAAYNAQALGQYFNEHRERLGFGLRVTKLGHIQRGGAPGVFDRLLGTRLGAAATEYLADNRHGVLLGWIKGEIAATSLNQVASTRKQLDTSLLGLAQVLAM